VIASNHLSLKTIVNLYESYSLII